MGVVARLAVFCEIVSWYLRTNFTLLKEDEVEWVFYIRNKVSHDEFRTFSTLPPDGMTTLDSTLKLPDTMDQPIYTASMRVWWIFVDTRYAFLN